MEQKQCCIVSVFRFFSYGTTEQFRFCTTVPFLHYCSVFALLFRFYATVPFFTRTNGTEWLCITVPVFSRGTKTEQCGIVSLFRFFHMELRNSFVFAPLFRFCITVPFLYHCSVFHKEQRNSVVLYHCSVFSQGTKTEQCGSVSLFRFFHMELRNSFVRLKEKKL